MLNVATQFNLQPQFIGGDKSISHRALIFASIAQSDSVITNLSLCQDVLSTVNCLTALGASITLNGSTAHVSPIRNAPTNVKLYCGNSGTTARLLAGLVAGLGITATFYGDPSLVRRPMHRVLQPLAALGAKYSLDCDDNDGFLFTIVGGNKLTGANLVAQVNSAQVKSAVLIAALFAHGNTTYAESITTRTHTEDLMRSLGAFKDNFVVGGSKFSGFCLDVPTDASSAAVIATLALLGGKSVLLPRVAFQPQRLGFFTALRQIGVDVNYCNVTNTICGSVADIRLSKANFSTLSPFCLTEADVCNAIDEIPLLSCIAAFIIGESKFCGVSELKVKESDRIEQTLNALSTVGCNASFSQGNLLVLGRSLHTHYPVFSFTDDHRMQMCQVALAVACGGGLVPSADCIPVSFPSFWRAIGVTPWRFAVVGSNVSASLSPLLMCSLSNAVGEWCSYQAVSLPQDCSDEILLATINAFHGVNVTMPFKSRVASLFAADIPSVNTVGANIRPTSTDGYGILQSLWAHGVDVSNAPLLVVGAGGAAEACLSAIREYTDDVVVINRTQSRADALTSKYVLNPTAKARQGALVFVPECNWEKTLHLADSCKFLLCASYCGTSGLLQQAQQRDIVVANGLEMLYHQGAKSFSLWTNTPLQNDFSSFSFLLSRIQSSGIVLQ